MNNSKILLKEWNRDSWMHLPNAVFELRGDEIEILNDTKSLENIYISKI